MGRNSLGHLLRADSISATANKATLFLRPTYSGRHTCDSLQCVWQGLEKANRIAHGQTFHERLLHKWAFLAEVHEEQAEVVIRCHDPAHFRAKVYSQNGRVPVEERNIRSGAILELDLPASLQGINTGENTYLFRGKNVNALCTKARYWLVNYYKDKGTAILWKAKVDTSYTAYDEFVLEVTHLNYEICPDGYFEYHRVYVKGIQKGEDVELSWEFQGKYGSGIIFPPRKNDYKDMDLHYKSNLDEYQKRLFKNFWNTSDDDYCQHTDHGNNYGFRSDNQPKLRSFGSQHQRALISTYPNCTVDSHLSLCTHWCILHLLPLSGF